MKNKTEVRKFLAQHEADKSRLAKLSVFSTVGCNHGFRKAAVFSSEAELLSLKVGEDSVLRRALIFNGNHPAFHNGTELLPKYRNL
jgi:hypothetical protein